MTHNSVWLDHWCAQKKILNDVFDLAVIDVILYISDLDKKIKNCCKISRLFSGQL